MILSEDGKVKIMGTGANTIGEFAAVSAAVTETLLNAGLPYEYVKIIMERTFYAGMREARKQKNETMPEMEEMDKAVNKFFDKCRDMLKDE